MVLIIIKLAAIGLAAISLAKSYVDFRKKKESFVMFAFWTIIWIGALILIVFPIVVEEIATYSKDKSITLGALTSFAFIFLLFIVYRVYAKAARIEYQQAELIRKLGLKKSLPRKK